MLKKEHRLRRDKEFKRVFKNGKGVFDAACGVKFMKNDLDISRFAVVVGTKVSKSAVNRNRLRRQYREIIKNHLHEIKTGHDVVFLSGKKALELSFEEKEARLLGVLKKARLLV